MKKNPLRKRILREFRQDFAKYLVIFAFMIMLICLVSGFLVADNSMAAAYKEGFDKYNIEDGHFVSAMKLDEKMIETIEKDADISIYNMWYADEAVDGLAEHAKLRVYPDREDLNLECLMEGVMPQTDSEVAMDRVFAKNVHLQVGDTIHMIGKDFTITGFVALPDYSCLFENNSDMMFDSIHFGVGLMTQDAFATYWNDENTPEYAYAWAYHNQAHEAETEEKDAADDVLEVLKKQVALKDFIPQYANKAIQFTGEDMGSDKAMFLLFDYIVVAIIAFVFAITISNTISAEAGVIGTLRALGYTKWELIRHYLAIPVVVTLIAAGIGNIIGYTVIKQYMADLYYNSYSLCTYETLWNMEAFVDTTVVPVLLMLVINTFVLIRKLRLTPQQFLRRDLKKHGKRKAIHLSSRIPFLHRFRFRILFQNVSNYLTLVLGIAFAGLIMCFGEMMEPMLEDYTALIQDSLIAKYQYILKTPVETKMKDAEKYAVTELETNTEKFMKEDVTIYGVASDSRYITAAIPKGKVLASNGYMDKYGLRVGDTLQLVDSYTKEEYTFEVAAEYKYDAAVAIFMNRTEFCETFDKENDYYSGYFAQDEITDIDDKYIAATVTQDDYLKISNQLKVSMGDFMALFKVFGVIMFILLMYLLSKQIIEKNTQSISMVKILGYSNMEIGKLYITSTTVVVIVGLLVSIPCIDALLDYLFHTYLYQEMTGYVPYIISNFVFVEMFLFGLASYFVVLILQFIKIRKIPLEEALKNVE